MLKFVMLASVCIFGTPALADDTDGFQDNLYKEEAAVVLLCSMWLGSMLRATRS